MVHPARENQVTSCHFATPKVIHHPSRETVGLRARAWPARPIRELSEGELEDLEASQGVKPGRFVFVLPVEVRCYMLV